ncbi:PA2778 family cysteine peptidase [Pseudomonas sp. 148P]|uniref:PA2778 family cysteine peptidase n=1 Tax=Pseudomonas ulcerans TaxID=3115852 RepID=A0ABU7HS88_9PSED|nr:MULTISPECIES: PA2778 family cysteine peptidase [unclassified Pseudomonas]MEE1923435.1 PA2778 family cysteine peptidase [Pseudomonas sp. 147P]MEE1934407.1 PA2778 family cysteine peptidase [Pseudomonas sp. 148P]
MIAPQGRALSARRQSKRGPMPILCATPRRLLAALLVAATLGGCASQPPAELKQLPQRVELSSVPFFRGNAHQSAPMALAAILSQQGVRITPGMVEEALKLPKDQERLQQSMATVARQYGMVVYPLDSSLPALLAQVAAGYPVLVRYQEGSAFWSEPRYALMVGYDRYKERVLLRAGNNRRMPMDFDSFESAWKKEGAWAVLVQQPQQLPARVDRQRWLKAANDLAQAGQEQAARRAVDAIGR